MAIFSIEEAEARLEELIARVEAGEQIIIARDETPVTRLDPLPKILTPPP
jgi:antitoxin (DNA-binding transcriptional repressor) of toxin-antitoxin stability system